MNCKRFEVGDLVIQYTERVVHRNGNHLRIAPAAGGILGLVTRMAGQAPYILWCDNEEGFGDHWIYANLEKA